MISGEHSKAKKTEINETLNDNEADREETEEESADAEIALPLESGNGSRPDKSPKNGKWCLPKHS